MDTLQAAKALQGAGFDEAQAEAVVNAIGQAVGDNVATKADIAEVRSDVRADLERLRAELYRAMAVQAIAIVAAVVAMLKFL